MGVANIQWGIAPIGWRNDDMPEIGADHTLGQLLSDIVVARFDGTEAGGFFPEATILKKELAMRQLKIAGKWFSSFILRDGLKQTLEEFHHHCRFLQAVGADVAVVSEQTRSIQSSSANIFTDKPLFTDDEWERLSAGLETLGQIAKTYDLDLVYHPHLGTGVQTKAEVEKLMAMTNKDYVHLLYDTGHAYVSDGEWLPLLITHLSRIKHVHFKDIREDVLIEAKLQSLSFRHAFLKGMFTVPGDGAIDFTQVYQVLIDSGYNGWVVIEAEQDPSIAHPLEYALKARAYIDQKLLNKVSGGKDLFKKDL